MERSERLQLAGEILAGLQAQLPGASQAGAGAPGGAEQAAGAQSASPQAGQTYRARFVRAGPVRTAGGGCGPLSIAAAALQAAAASGLFDRRAVFIDHSPAGEHPSLRRLAGVTLAARWDPLEQAVEGCLRLYDTSSGREAARLLDALLDDRQSAPDVGLSLVFYPLWDEAQVVGIRAVDSVDLVFQPAADGRVLQALHRTYPLQDSKGEPTMSESTQPIEERQAGQPARQAEPTRQAEGAPHAAPALAAGERGAAAVAGHANLLQPAADWQAALAESAAQALLMASGLPEASRARLAAAHYPAPDDLARAIAGERAYLAALQADGVVQIGGVPPRADAYGRQTGPAGRIEGMRTGLERVQLALDGLLSGARPPEGVQPLTGIRELYHLLSGDYELSGVFQPERIQFAGVTSSTMASMVANALNKVIASEFAAYPRWWEAITVQQDFASLQNIRWISLGGIGELPTVAEGAAYSELSWDDSYETAAFVKKGGYLGITMEAIDKDDTGRLAAAPRALAQAAWLTLSKSIAAIFTGSAGAGPDMSDGKALFHTDRGNLGTTALSIGAYSAARSAMRKFTELNSGERLGALTAPKYLLVPPDLEITALQVLASEYDYGYAAANTPAAPVNPHALGDSTGARMNAARSRVIVVDLWTDSADWAAVADPRLWPTIGVGFRYGRQPEVFSVASPTVGLMFSNDTLPVKARFFFAAGPMDWRGLYKCNVA
ncbi:MAG: hypothetical protein ACKOC5_03870 [Chloroflexota bacterium]